MSSRSKKALRKVSSVHLRWPSVIPLVDHQPFDLVEHRRVGGVAVRAVGPSRRDQIERRLLRLHRADLHRRGVGPEQHRPPVRIRPIQIETVVHRPRRMILGKIERGEIVPIVLDLGPGGDRKAEIGENLGELVHHLADRVQRFLACPPRLGASCRASRRRAAPRARHPRAQPCAPRSPRSTASRRRWMRGPSAWRSSGVMPPSVFSSAVTSPCLPKAATRTASSAGMSAAARIRPSQSLVVLSRSLPMSPP